jgi:hypothetical protein
MRRKVSPAIASAAASSRTEQASVNLKGRLIARGSAAVEMSSNLEKIFLK